MVDKSTNTRSRNKQAKKLGKKVEIEVLKPYTTSPSGKFHLRELARKLGMNHTSLRPHLNSLKSKGIIKEKTEGRNRVFYLNQTSKLLPYYLVQAEADRTFEFLKDKKEIMSLWKGFENKIDLKQRVEIDLLVLFGSFVRGDETEESDIDLFLSAPEKTSIEVEKVLQSLESVVGRSINVEVVKSLRKFLSGGVSRSFDEIVENHIILIGPEKFVQTLRWLKYER